MHQASLFSIARAALISILLSGFGFQFSALAVQSATLNWDPSTDSNVAGYKVYYGTVSHNYTNVITLGNVTNATVTGLLEGVTYFFAATSYDTSGVESIFSNEASYAVPTNSTVLTNQPPSFQPPTLNAINNISINENAALQTVSLSGITGISLGTINLSLSPVIVAVSSNPALIPAPTVNYTIPNTAGTLTFTLANGVTGTATVTVTINNGQSQSNLVSRSFTVTVIPVAQPPTLDPIGNLTIVKNSAAQTVSLSGITSGATNQNQKIKVTASSSNRSLITSLSVNYTSPKTTGTLTFKPGKNATGTATITVTVNNGSKSINIVTQKFTVTILAQNPVNPPATTQSTNAPSTSVSRGRGSSSPAVLPAMAATLTSAARANGQFTFDVSGTSDASYIVQASTNLVDWENVQTNTAPFTFADPDASKFSQRFYRAVPQPQ